MGPSSESGKAIGMCPNLIPRLTVCVCAGKRREAADDVTKRFQAATCVDRSEPGSAARSRYTGAGSARLTRGRATGSAARRRGRGRRAQVQTVDTETRCLDEAFAAAAEVAGALYGVVAVSGLVGERSGEATVRSPCAQPRGSNGAAGRRAESPRSRPGWGIRRSWLGSPCGYTDTGLEGGPARIVRSLAAESRRGAGR